MRKFLLVLALIVSSILVVLLFITATTYLQLVVAILSYPVLAYFALRLFSVKKKKTVTPTPVTPTVQTTPAFETAPASPEEQSDILDLDKRSFLKFIGATSILFFVSSVLGRFVGNTSLVNNFPLTNGLPGVSPAPASAGNQGSTNAIISSGYTITEIDNGIVSYYGFTSKDGAWLIMKEDTNNNSFRYSKGTQNFPANWAGRAGLDYDYYYNLF